MAYCLAADIQKDFPGVVFDTTSKVKLADIPDFITDADALIDSYLSARYVVPVTGSESLAVLKFYSRTLVSDKVKGLLEIKQQTNQNANQNVRSGLTSRDILKLLADLRDGNSQLPDAVLAKSGGGINSFNVKNGVVPEFKKDTEAW